MPIGRSSSAVPDTPPSEPTRAPVLIKATAKRSEVQMTARSKPWNRKNPKKASGRSKKLTPSQKASAKASAKRAGRPYPNLVDNMRAASKKKSAKKKSAKKRS